VSAVGQVWPVPADFFVTAARSGELAIRTRQGCLPMKIGGKVLAASFGA